MNRVELQVGERFGRLTVSEVGIWEQGARRRYALVRCLCDCGKEKVVRQANLRQGVSRSCGCAGKSRADAVVRLTTHGLSKHPHYQRWYNMVERCTRPRHHAYPDYGGRGIGVAPEWLEPKPFLDYLDAELGPCPPGHSLDRVDNERGYEPGNLKWSTWPEQALNRRKRKLAS